MYSHLHRYSLANCFVFVLTVGPHFITNPITSQEVAINRGFRLTCSAEGFPIPSIVWFMNNTMISNGMTIVQSTLNINSSTLIISNPIFNDSGMYYCQAVSSEFPDVNVISTIAIVTIVGELINTIFITLIHLLVRNYLQTC